MNKKKSFTAFKVLAAYLVAAWTFLQFVDWALNRYHISPYWVDVLLWFFVGIIPSLVIYLYHKERIDQRILKLREKIFFPLNIVLLAIALYVGFGNSDLGATTKEINYTDEQGEAQSALITKEEFRLGIPIYNFNNSQNNDSLNWLSSGIGRLLELDLEQNKSLSPDFANLTETAEKIRQASMFHDFYVDGDFEKNDNEIHITVYIRKATNAKILHEQQFKGTDLLSILDDASIFVTEQAGFVETNTLKYLDLPLKGFLSESEEAIKYFLEKDYLKAIATDSTFAMAYLDKSKYNRIFSRGSLERKDMTAKAFKYRRKLPLQKQLEVAIELSLAYEDYETAESQVNLQLEVDPTNLAYNSVLFSIYGEKKELNKYLKRTQELFEIDPNINNAGNLMWALITNGQNDELLNYLNKYELINPSIRIYKLSPYLFKGDIDAAEELLNDIRISYPEYDRTSQAFGKAIDYLKENTPGKEFMEQFVGNFRSDKNEQQVSYWIDDNRLIRSVKNQRSEAVLPAGSQTVFGGLIGWQVSFEELIKDSNGKVIGLLAEQSNNEKSLTLWAWREDQSIQQAYEAFDKGDLEKAAQLFEVAHASNPKHSYLKNMIDHINYIQTSDEETIRQQHMKYVGTYGPRQFTFQDGKFYYKRKSADSELPKMILLPIDENKYISRSRRDNILFFEEDDSGKLVSKSYRFIVGDSLRFEWQLSTDNNTFLKDD